MIYTIGLLIINTEPALTKSRIRDRCIAGKLLRCLLDSRLAIYLKQTPCALTLSALHFTLSARSKCLLSALPPKSTRLLTFATVSIRL